MPMLLETADVRAVDRAEAIRELIWSTVVRVEIAHHPDPERIFARGVIGQAGRLSLCSVRSNATTVRRTPSLARDELEPSVFVGLQVSGSSVVVQNGREAVLTPGNLAIYDTTTPYTLVNDGGIHQHFFRVSHRDLALPPSLIRDVTATTFSRDDVVVDLATAHLSRLARNPAIAERSGGDAIGQASIELIRAVIVGRVGADRLAAEVRQTTLEYQILEYARSHLAEHDLSANRIAAALSISVRHLYATLAKAGITLGDWVREQRLEACRQDLARPEARSMTIAAVSRRWGFVDPTHFGRAFKDTYGMSPKEWRQHNLTG